jgi:hypothetical protein
VSLASALEAFARGDLRGLATALAGYLAEGLAGTESAFVAAVDALATGLAMVADDLADLGRLDRLHHWLVGLLLVAVAIIALVALMGVV